MIVVADAGPILHLYWIECLDWGLPPTRIYVVEEVWAEVARHAPAALRDSRFARRTAPAANVEWQARFSLDSGETAAIAFALEHAGSLLLTDDEAARRACAALELPAVGSPGSAFGEVNERSEEAALRQRQCHAASRALPCPIARERPAPFVGTYATADQADVRLDNPSGPHIIVRYGAPGRATKGGKVRRVPLIGPAVEVVRTWLAMLPSYAPKNPHRIPRGTLRGEAEQRRLPGLPAPALDG